MSVLSDSKIEGKLFESLVFRQAQANGLLVIHNHLTAKWKYGGRLQVVKGELDFKIIKQGTPGAIAYVDAKSYGTEHFTHSAIEPHQLARSDLYNEWGIQSGFIVHFRPNKRVVFFTGRSIMERGPGTRMTADDGLILGTWDRFDLKLLFAPAEEMPD